MGAITVSLDETLVQTLSHCLPLDVVIETGIFEGATAEMVCPFFKKIYTIESSEKYYQNAKNKFKQNLKISVIRGNSAASLEAMPYTENQSIIKFHDKYKKKIEFLKNEFKNHDVLTMQKEIALLREFLEKQQIISQEKTNEIGALQEMITQKDLLLLHGNENNEQYDYKKIAQERLIEITRLAAQLKKYHNKKLFLKLKFFLAPRLGKLYQHAPISVQIPYRYWKTKTLSAPPKISIVTPSFNQGHFLEQTILSVLQQNYSNLEYIIQDGGSSDNSLEIIKQHKDNLHYYESKKDKGQSNAINLGFSHSNGEIMAYLNSDDLLLPGSLNYIAHYFETHPDVDVVYGNRITIDENSLEVGRWILPPHSNKILDWVDFIPQETLFWRRHIWNKVGATIDEHFQFAMDWDLLLRFKKADAKFARLPRLLGAFRVHSQQKTSAQINHVGLKEMSELRFRAHGRVVSHWEIRKKIIPYLIKHIFFQKLHRIQNKFLRMKELPNSLVKK